MMFSQDSTLIGDVDCSGEVNSQDASLILQFVTNVIDELPCEANMTGLTPDQLQEMIDMMENQLNINYNVGGCTSFGDVVNIEIAVDDYYEFENNGILIAQLSGNGSNICTGFNILNDLTGGDSAYYFYHCAYEIITIPIKEGQYLDPFNNGSGLPIFKFTPLQCDESTTTPNNNSGSNNKTLMYTIDGF